jgi:hypothetical protein
MAVNSNKNHNRNQRGQEMRVPDGHGGMEGDLLYNDAEERQAHGLPETQDASTHREERGETLTNTRSHGNRPKISRGSRVDHR